MENNIIRCYLGASAVDFYTDFNVVVQSVLRHNPHYRSHRRHNKVILTSVIDRPTPGQATAEIRAGADGRAGRVSARPKYFSIGLRSPLAGLRAIITISHR